MFSTSDLINESSESAEFQIMKLATIALIKKIKSFSDDFPTSPQETEVKNRHD